jgi:hypothetical protein
VNVTRQVLSADARFLRRLASTVEYSGSMVVAEVEGVVVPDVTQPEDARVVKLAVRVAVRSLRLAAAWCDREARRG